MRSKIQELTESPPPTLSPTGLAILHRHQAGKLRGQDAIESYQSLLENAPTTPPWSDFRIEAKIQLTAEMLRQKQPLAEIQTVLDSIDPQKVPDALDSHYQTVRTNLQTAQAPPEQP